MRLSMFNLTEFLIKQTQIIEIERVCDFDFNFNFKINHKYQGYIKDTRCAFLYGFCACLNDEQKRILFAEVQKNKTNKLDKIDYWISLSDNIYPLYWGIEDKKFERFYAHIIGHKNSNLDLKQYNSLDKVDIIYANIMVNDNDKLEDHLNNNFTPLLKTINKSKVKKT